MIKKISFLVLFLYTFAVYGSMAMMSIASGLVFALFLYKLFQKDFLQNLKTIPIKYYKTTALLSFACIWSLFWAKYSGLTFFEMSPSIDVFKHSYKLWHIWFPFILVALIQSNQEDTGKIVKTWLLFGITLVCLGILQYHFPIGWPQRLPHLDYDTYVKPTGIARLYKGSYHANGLSGFHLSFASIIIFPTAVWFTLFVMKLRNEGFTNKVKWMGLGSILFFMTNILTYSKTTWLVMPLLVVAISAVMLTKKVKIPLIGMMILFVVIGTQTSEFKLRFQGTDTMKERFEVWGANLEMIRQYPLFGVGWQQNSQLTEAYYKSKNMHGFISHAHNNFLDQFASTGLFGFVLFLIWNVMNIYLALDIYRKSKNELFKSFGLGTAFAWGSFHFFGLTQTNFWDAKVMHQMGWVIALTLVIHYKTMVDWKYGK